MAPQSGPKARGLRGHKKVVPGAAQRRRYGAAWLREAVFYARTSGEVIVSFVKRRGVAAIIGSPTRCG